MEAGANGDGGALRRSVLSIDGGGVRGLIPAMILAEVERRTSRPAAELFDLIAGTSTGGIVALGLVMPGPDGMPRWSAADLVDFYVAHSAEVFSHEHRQVVRSLDGYLHEKYAAAPLEAILTRYFGEVCLSEAVTDVLVPAYDVIAQSPYFFRSAEARVDPAHDCLMSAAARATSAAPTYFEPHELGDGAAGAVLVDGGVYANNPAMCAFEEMQRGGLGARLRILSLGTGEMTRHLPRDKLRHWGLAQWARPIIHIVLEGVSQTAHVQLAELLPAEDYLRLQVSLTKACDQLDDASPANVQALREHAEELITSHSHQLDAFCGALLAGAEGRA